MEERVINDGSSCMNDLLVELSELQSVLDKYCDLNVVVRVKGPG